MHVAETAVMSSVHGHERDVTADVTADVTRVAGTSCMAFQGLHHVATTTQALVGALCVQSRGMRLEQQQGVVTLGHISGF